MARELTLEDEEGWIEIKNKDGSGGQKIDLWEAFIFLIDIGDRYLPQDEDGKPTGPQDRPAYYQAIIEWLRGKGMPTVSQWAAMQFGNRITDICEELQKKNGGDGKPGSPSSTESTPSS